MIVNCSECFAAFCAGAQVATAEDRTYAAYCQHDRQVWIARPLPDGGLDLQIADGVSPEDVARITATAGADVERQALSPGQLN